MQAVPLNSTVSIFSSLAFAFNTKLQSENVTFMTRDIFNSCICWFVFSACASAVTVVSSICRHTQSWMALKVLQSSTPSFSFDLLHHILLLWIQKVICDFVTMFLCQLMPKLIMCSISTINLKLHLPVRQPLSADAKQLSLPFSTVFSPDTYWMLKVYLL